MRTARGGLHGGNIGMDLGAERVIYVVRIGGRNHFRRASQAEVEIARWNDGVTATTTQNSVSEKQEAYGGGMRYLSEQ